MVGLTIYGTLSHGARLAWIGTAERAARGSDVSRRFFCSALLLAKGRAFGFDLNTNWSDYNFAQCPRGLPDEMFVPVYGDLKQGKGEAHVEAITFGSLIDKAKTFASDHSKFSAGYLAATTFGGAMIAKAKEIIFIFVKRYIPEVVATIPESLGPLMSKATLIGTGGVLLYDAEVPGINRADLAAYDTDNERRLYDNTVYSAGP